MNRVITRTADSQTTSWAYSPSDLWVRVTNPEGTDSLVFDAAGRTLRALAIRNSVTYRMENQLDAMGNRTQLSAYGPWSGAHVARFHYNADFRLDSIIDFSGRASTLAYNADGQLQGVAIPGDGMSRGYSSVHAPYEITHDNLGLLGALDISYNHDQNGLIGSRIMNYDDGLTTGQMVRTYTYDRKGQLTQRTARRIPEGSGSCGSSSLVDANGGACVPSGGFSAPGASWSWDRVGNPTGTGVTVDTGNRLTAYGGFTMEYDADGNMTRRYSGSNDQRLYWNSLGQLDSVTTNGVKVAYGYNGLGQRVRRTQGSTTTRMLYDGDDLLMDLDASGNPLREYTYYPGIDDPHSVYKPGTGGAYYYSSDYPGSVYALTNPSGTVVARYDYAEFGAITVAFDSVAQPLKYMARELDEASGLYYVRARWYHPALIRFISEDPIRSVENMYAFAGNSPTTARDATGLDPTIEECIKDEIKAGRSEDMARGICGSDPFRVGGVTATATPWPFSTPRNSGESRLFGKRSSIPIQFRVQLSGRPEREQCIRWNGDLPPTPRSPCMTADQIRHQYARMMPRQLCKATARDAFDAGMGQKSDLVTLLGLITGYLGNGGITGPEGSFTSQPTSAGSGVASGVAAGSAGLLLGKLGFTDLWCDVAPEFYMGV